MNPAALLRTAATLGQQGKHAEAAAVYRTLLQKFPLREDANKGLLIALESSGAWAELEQQAGHLLERLPQFLPAWLSLARALLMQQKDALAACQRCVKLDPKNPGAYDYLGVACRRAGRLDEAAVALKNSLRLRPHSLSTRSNLANVWREAGRLSEAVQLYKEVLEADPQRLDTFYNYALALSDLGHLQAAEQLLRQLLSNAPGLADAHNALGSVLQTQGRLPEAEQAYRAALAIKPDMPDAVSNLLLVLHNQNKLTEMQPYLGRAVALMPSSAMFRLAALVFALPKMAGSQKDAAQRLAQFDAGLDAYALWRDAAVQQGGLRHDRLANLPFALAYLPGNHKDRLSRFADLSAQENTQPPQRPDWAPRAAGERIRLGIVSAHIRRHSVWDIVLKGLIEHLDASLFELTIYHLGAIEDAQTELAKQAVAQWRDAGSLAGSTGWADRIAQDRQDVLYYPELGMDTVCYGLAQQRLAPLQAAGWGHPITTGLATIDLFFSGQLIEPEDGQAHYREHLIRLPGTGCCTRPFEIEVGLEIEAQASEAVARLMSNANGASLFLIPQSLLKFAPEFDAVYVEIARRLGPCRFVIPVSESMQGLREPLHARLAAAFDAAGLKADDFVAFLPWLNEGEFRHALQVCTVFLDCPAFSGYTTAWKAVREGIPVLTLEGPFMRQRLAAGLLRQIGMPDLIAGAVPAYIDKAVALAQEPAADQQARRRAIAAAAPRADHDVSVVRAFERELLKRMPGAPALSP
ncbi:tetratricopeptide repeat protein [Roseateles koreensis]|uniref:protein O-GlcNAc transferase n=1 Tax=Roseateles koreensis TaxID=2987526 RepID=A0ABT5KSH9_9BURK|nr:tetratricopeptide repeat protein [Roseateles koreensis]MDC8785894.1 tetratricopeptide repeat protein [Roseateles koreensis]